MASFCPCLRAASERGADVIPIRQLLSRIKWDAEFGAARFELGYYDRLEGRIIRVGLEQVEFEPRRRDTFLAFNGDGVLHRIPLHRIRRVYRNGELIWQRPGPL